MVVMNTWSYARTDCREGEC